MKPVLIFRHMDCEGPGYLADFLQNHGIPYTLVCVDTGSSVPEHIDAISGLVFMGGYMSVNDPLEWIRRETSLIREAMEADIPVLGHCLGGQLVAASLGASITANPVREFGWHPVSVTDNIVAENWFGPDIKTFECFHWHSERFDVPDGAVPLLSSQHCDNQAFAIGKTLAMQCHIEMTTDMIHTWLDRFSDQLIECSDSIQSPSEMLENVEERVQMLNRMADRVYENWIRGLSD